MDDRIREFEAALDAFDAEWAESRPRRPRSSLALRSSFEQLLAGFTDLPEEARSIILQRRAAASFKKCVRDQAEIASLGIQLLDDVLKEQAHVLDILEEMVVPQRGIGR